MAAALTQRGRCGVDWQGYSAGTVGGPSAVGRRRLARSRWKYCGNDRRGTVKTPGVACIATWRATDNHCASRAPGASFSARRTTRRFRRCLLRPPCRVAEGPRLACRRSECMYTPNSPVSPSRSSCSSSRQSGADTDAQAVEAIGDSDGSTRGARAASSTSGRRRVSKARGGVD
jgi:hypothetical protein